MHIASHCWVAAGDPLGCRCRLACGSTTVDTNNLQDKTVDAAELSVSQALSSSIKMALAMRSARLVTISRPSVRLSVRPVQARRVISMRADKGVVESAIGDAEEICASGKAKVRPVLNVQQQRLLKYSSSCALCSW